MAKTSSGSRNFIADMKDQAQAATHSQNSRAGNTLHEIAVARKKNVSRAAIAQQLTDNSKRNNPDAPEVFTESDVESGEKLWRANRSRKAFTKANREGLTKVAESSVSISEDFSNSPSTPQPA